MNKIITISREFGSGGHELGRELAQLLGVAYYDQEIVSEIAHRTKMSEEYIQHLMESRPDYIFPIHTGLSFLLLENPIWTQNQKVYKEQCDVILEAADRSDCVVVGRCADYILREKNPFRIFVYADMDSKIKRCREREENYTDLKEKGIIKKIKEIDKNRSQYYDFFTNQEWGDKENYDLCINTTGKDIKKVAESLAEFIKNFIEE